MHLREGLICEHAYKKMATMSGVMGVSLTASCFLVWLEDPDFNRLQSDCTCWNKRNESMPVCAAV